MMQTLLIDLGNTRCKWAWHDGRVLQASSVLLHRGQEFPALLTQAFARQPRPDRVYIASVADVARRDMLVHWLREHWSISADLLISPAAGNGLKNAYLEPARLGCDRWAAMVAAFQQARSAVCVVDLGSAITLDVVAASGQHLGGLILPGLHAMGDALTRHTTLDAVDFSQDVSALLATSTQAAMARGITYAVSSLITQLLSDLKQQRQIAAACYLTGGDSTVIAPLLQLPYVIDPDLVLKGLALIAHPT